MNALQLLHSQFQIKKHRSRIYSRKMQFLSENVHFAFLAPRPSGALRQHAVRHWKARIVCPATIELISLSVRAEALWAKIDWNCFFFVRVSAKFTRRMGHAKQSFLHGQSGTDKLMNALQHCRWRLLHKETLLQTFFQRSAILHWKRPFWALLAGLRATYHVHLKLIGKCVLYFLLALDNWKFLAKC